jgi:hypothetical protein
MVLLLSTIEYAVVVRGKSSMNQCNKTEETTACEEDKLSRQVGCCCCNFHSSHQDQVMSLPPFVLLHSFHENKRRFIRWSWDGDGDMVTTSLIKLEI